MAVFMCKEVSKPLLQNQCYTFGLLGRDYENINLINIKMKTKIRTEVLNLTLDTWQKIKQITVNGQIEVTPKELIDLIGFDGGQFLSGKLNDEERIFVDSYYKFGRALEKQTDV